jgi:hypothetical protein
MKRINRNDNQGQAMTEFVISAAFVLVPLFIIIPIVGKYVDVKQATVQAARYEAWEYTVNYSNLNEEPSGFTAVGNSRKPVKPVTQVQRESRQRFFSRGDLPIDSVQDRAGFDQNQVNPLWRYHDVNRTAIYDEQALDAESRLRQNGTPDQTGVLTNLFRVIQIVFGALADVLSAISGAVGGPPIGFDAINVEGYYKATVAAPVAEPPRYRAFSMNNTAVLFLERRNIVMQADAGVLSRGWSAGGVAHTQSQARGMVPTALLGIILNNPLPLQDVVSAVLLSPELHSDSLQFGHMDIDAVHPSALESSGGHDCPGGYCTY